MKAPRGSEDTLSTAKKSGRELELESLLADRDGKLTAAARRALEAERTAAEFERENQELKKIPAGKPKKVKRSMMEQFLSGEDDDE